MTTPLVPQLLDSGLAAIQLASGDGVKLRITHVALGDAGYTPTAGQTGLQHEIVRYPIADGKSVGPRQLHLTALADDGTEFWVREVGFVLEGGAFLAVWSDPSKALAYKQAGLELLLAYDLTLAGVPPDSVVVQSTGAGLNLHLAEELASLAASAVAGMQVDLQQDAQLAHYGQELSVVRTHLEELNQRAMRSEIDHGGRLARVEEAQRQHGNQLLVLAESNRQTTQRLDALASQQTSEHANLLALHAANSAAIVDLQNHYLKGVTA
ncbi:phage tail protein [Chromobacterium phragmitis]|uniref:phage tail-collar fiber domain-containing protein n=1 Tax=Chromobacterium amazonense TaxID=1382803 RepID=UPI0021B7ECB9|nr:phage tail protein [Chromobacterium amazonense]MBM2883173.1 phage tail protein [Chromobacterium amazonense]MDE1716447.1 phage tail protein [Chromobacterium amazonense]